jgi:hypothetical protein
MDCGTAELAGCAEGSTGCCFMFLPQVFLPIPSVRTKAGMAKRCRAKKIKAGLPSLPFCQDLSAPRCAEDDGLRHGGACRLRGKDHRSHGDHGWGGRRFDRACGSVLSVKSVVPIKQPGGGRRLKPGRQRALLTRRVRATSPGRLKPGLPRREWPSPDLSPRARNLCGWLT